ncbi:MAG: ferredoxin reductase [Chloroflexi bacterium]|nr:ferredoxin reductase [Chloroflexota bacterium]
MAVAPGPGLIWQSSTVESIVDASPRVKLFRLKMAEPRKFRAGQHFDIRLTAPDGYKAQRSYSVSSSPEDPGILEFAIELIHDGEVSSYFHEAVQPGEEIEIRGPIGGHFTWSPELAKPVIFIAGGSGIAPIMSMLRQRFSSPKRATGSLLFSVRTKQDILFRGELEHMMVSDPTFRSVVTLTRDAHADWTGPTRRIDIQMIESAVKASGQKPERAYICGGTGFVESIATMLFDSGLNYDDIRIERFGP